MGDSSFAATTIMDFNAFLSSLYHYLLLFISKKRPRPTTGIIISTTHHVGTVCTICPLFQTKPCFFCSACPMGKAHQFAFPSFSLAKSSKPLDLVWDDVWGPTPNLSRMGFKYYLLIVDHFIGFTWFFTLKKKSDVLSIFFILYQFF